MRFIPLKDGSGKYKDTQTGQVGYITRGKGGGWYLADTPNRTSLGEFKKENKYSNTVNKMIKEEPFSRKQVKASQKYLGKYGIKGINSYNEDEKNKINPTANIEGGANTRVKRNWNRYSEEQRREEREKVLRQKIQDYKNKKNNWENTNKIYESALEKARPDIQEYLKDKKGFVNDEDYIKELAIETNTHIETARAIFNEEKNKIKNRNTGMTKQEEDQYIKDIRNAKDFNEIRKITSKIADEKTRNSREERLFNLQVYEYDKPESLEYAKKYLEDDYNKIKSGEYKNLGNNFNYKNANDEYFRKEVEKMEQVRKDIAEGKIEPVEKLKIEKFKAGKNNLEEPKSSYTKSGKLNYKQFGIVSTPEASFSDDGTRFSAYRLPNGMEMTVAKDSDDIYLSVRNPYHKEVSYEEYSSLPHYKDLDMYNGVRKDSVDLNKVIESSNAYMEEYNALLRKKGIPVDTRNINERRLDDINSQIKMAQESYKYHNENQDYTRWRYHRNEARKAYNKEIKLNNQKEKLIAEIEGFRRRKR